MAVLITLLMKKQRKPLKTGVVINIINILINKQTGFKIYKTYKFFHSGQRDVPDGIIAETGTGGDIKNGAKGGWQTVKRRRERPAARRKTADRTAARRSKNRTGIARNR